MNVQPIIVMLMNQLQTRNPKMASEIKQAMESGVNPKDFMKQVMGNVSNSDMQQMLQQASNLGVPNDVLQQFQNMK